MNSGKLNKTCVGTGLIALDVVLNGKPETPAKLFAGGSCGNVLTILSYLGWQTYPVARFAKNKATKKVELDFKTWKVNTSLITRTETGSTPIIIHRILKDKNGVPKHKFEFRDPQSGRWFPQYKPVLVKDVDKIQKHLPEQVHCFYFDRISRGNIDLALINKKAGALIFFEPSSLGDNIKQFEECLSIADIVKFSSDRIPNYRMMYPKAKSKLEIETFGSEGLQFRFNSGNWTSLKPYKLLEIKDSAGSGDWCSAGILHSLLSHDKPFQNLTLSAIRAALNYGQILGALNCLFNGARGAMYRLTRKEFQDLAYQIAKRKKINASKYDGPSNSIHTITSLNLKELYT